MEITKGIVKEVNEIEKYINKLKDKVSALEEENRMLNSKLSSFKKALEGIK